MKASRRRIRAATGAAVAVVGVVLALTTTADAGAAPPVAPPDHSAAAVDEVTPDRLLRAEAADARLDAKEGHVPADVTDWYVDDVTGDTIVSTLGMPTPADEAFAADPDPAEVLLVPFSSTPHPIASTDLLGGQTVTNSGVRCSVGFNALTSAGKPVFLTAGHCTKTAGTWAGVNRAAIGPVATTAWPKVDYGSVSVANTAAWAARAQVAGGPAVKGTTVAPVNAQVCRSGSTTGYRCGSITARNVSVNYGNGTVVNGLTKTSACAEGGDSGGSFITPSGQAQGVASGAVGDCTKGGGSYFQPIAPVLAALKLRLVTSP